MARVNHLLSLPSELQTTLKSTLSHYTLRNAAKVEAQDHTLLALLSTLLPPHSGGSLESRNEATGQG